MDKFNEVITGVLFEYDGRKECPLLIETNGEPWAFSDEEIKEIYINLVNWLSGRQIIKINQLLPMIQCGARSLYIDHRSGTSWRFSRLVTRRQVLPFISKCMSNNISLIID